MAKMIPRSKSLMLPEVQNPFVHRIQLSTRDKIQVAIMSVTVAPLRVLLVLLCLVVAWFFAIIAMARRSREDMKKPMSGWRRGMKGFMTALGRLCFFFFGFHRVDVVGECAEPSETNLLVGGPHSSFFDAIVLFIIGLPSTVSRVENKGIPLLGKLTQFTQPVFVSREDPNSRLNTIKQIETRAHSGGAWPQIFIFPEGTCTNRSCLITFKPGAFYPGLPVQPVCLKYRNAKDTATWTWDGPGAFTVFWLTICQLQTNLEIEFLPVYYPNEEEKKDARLFATNVRKEMAKCLGVPVTDHTFEDCRLMEHAARMGFPAASGIVEFNKLSKKLGLKLQNMKDILDKFCSMSQKMTGNITLEEFAAYLDLPVSEALEEIFDLYDRDDSGTINFREYVIGLSLISQPANDEETIRFAFKLFDKSDSGYISEEELADMLSSSFGVEDEDALRLFEQIDQDQDGKITYDEFKAYAEEKPEYARLFKAYRELQGNTNDTKVNGSSTKVKSQ